MGDRPNVVASVLAAAQSRHRDHEFVQLLVEWIKTEQATIKNYEESGRKGPYLSGYAAGAEGKQGFGLMYSVPSGVFDDTLYVMSAHCRLAVLVDLAAKVLNDLGEEIERL